MEACKLVRQMTLEEKAELCSGSSFWYTKGIKRLGLEPVMLADGPLGLRKQNEGNDHLGMGVSVPATCFPAGVNLGSSWEVELCREIGEALGAECVAESVAVILAPAINMKRNPLCGRNFEYFSEDPHLAGECAAAFIGGVQSRGVGCSVKHFAANNQEYNRLRVDTIVDERTLREIYLPAFERAVMGAQPWSVMSAYNRLNGTYCSDSTQLLTSVLRDEWRFRGLVVSDWGGTNDRVAGVRNGLDLEMPTSGGLNDRRILRAIAAGELQEAELDVAATRVTQLLLAARARPPPPAQSECEALLRRNHELARRAALHSAVLLKNDGALLPLPTGLIGGDCLRYRIAVIGAFAESPRFQGAGSARVNAHTVDCPLDAIRKAAGDSACVTFAPGYHAVSCRPDAAAIDAAVATVQGAQAVVLLAGLPSAFEAEGVDRPHMQCPEQMERLISAIADVSSDVVVVLLGGAPMELPWLPRVRSVLYMGLGGQAMGGALADLLFGAVAPSGKLAETWPVALAHCPSQSNFATHPRQVVYREGLNVGYRFFATAHATPPLFAFGHGLSYAAFEYGLLQLSLKDGGQSVVASRGTPTDILLVSLTVRNVGQRTAAEVVQLYVRDVQASVHRPDRELRAFAKIKLHAGASEELRFELAPRAFAFYDTQAADWYVEPGAFEILVGSSSDDIRQCAVYEVLGESRSTVVGQGPPMGYTLFDDAALARLGCIVPPTDPPAPYDVNTTLQEASESGWIAWLIFHAVLRVATLGARISAARAGLGDGPATVAIVDAGIRCMTFRNMQLMTGGALSDRLLNFVVQLLNGRYGSALRALVCPE